MTIQIINNSTDWDQFYAYSKGGHKPKKYPLNYPCYARKELIEGGLGGDYWNHYICEIPEFEIMSRKEIFEAGLNVEWKLILSA